ncbi:MAG: hypothetical protein EP343_13370 [Deltaproteobacteria bacterium]|nr:MAG: hypothetical protein EP343_13370 [Deltaproteobacteria bacterium]
MERWNRHLKAVWSLSQDEGWSTLYNILPDSRRDAVALEDTAEVAASLCAQHFPEDMQWSAEMGGLAMLAFYQKGTVFFSFHDPGQNPLLMRSAIMQVARQQQRPNPQMISDAYVTPPYSLQSVSAPSMEEPATVSVIRSDEREERSEGMDSSQSSPSSRSWKQPPEIADTDSTIETAKIRQYTSISHLPQPPMVSDSALEFSQPNLPTENERDEAGSPAPIVVSPTLEESPQNNKESSQPSFSAYLDDVPDAISQEALPAAKGVCRWKDIEAFVRKSIECAKEYIGPTVSANYWKKAIAGQPKLETTLRVKPLGGVEVEQAEQWVTGHDARSLQESYDRWIQLCQRVIRDFPALLKDIDTPPWTQSKG